MADDLDIELDDDSRRENKRIKDLSEKVRTTAEERDNERKLREASEAKAIETQRERDFYAGFADIVATNPNAKDFRDDILAKVKSGYPVEDATFAVLGKAGKLTPPAPKPVDNPAGGSAVNQIPSKADKSLEEMNHDEKRSELEKHLQWN